VHEGGEAGPGVGGSRAKQTTYRMNGSEPGGSAHPAAHFRDPTGVEVTVPRRRPAGDVVMRESVTRRPGATATASPRPANSSLCLEEVVVGGRDTTGASMALQDDGGRTEACPSRSR